MSQFCMRGSPEVGAAQFSLRPNIMVHRIVTSGPPTPTHTHSVLAFSFSYLTPGQPMDV